MELIETVRRDLAQHHKICEDLLEMIQQENCELRQDQTIKTSESTPRRKKVLALLVDSLERIKSNRVKWLRLDRGFRAGHPEILDLLRQTQDVIAKVMLYDRENEQLHLRRGLVPSTHIPSIHQQRPHYVAGLYQRHASG